MKLHDLQRVIEQEKYAKPLCSPLQSFYRDITLNEEGARRLPVVAACAAPKEWQIVENIHNFAPILRVQIPGVIQSEWEGEIVNTQIVEGPPPEATSAENTLPPLVLDCHFADTMAFFASGHVAYTLSIIFRPESFPQWEGNPPGKIPVFPSVILCLLDLARTDMNSTLRQGVKFGFSRDPRPPKSLDDFVFSRLHSLANRSSAATSEFTDIFRGIVWPIRASKHWAKPKSGDESDFARFKYADLQSATCEIIEFGELERLKAYIQAAKEYKAAADPFGKGVAGLAQDVIDFEDQDDHEVSDSLISAGAAGGYVHFINAKSIIRFYRRSRSFERMQHFIGGDPYFYFTALAAVYNEYLINSAARALSELKPGVLIEASPFESTKAELEIRYRIFAAYLRSIIPNLFRYKTESAMFDHIHERRGITLRQESIETELSRYEIIAHDFENLNMQRSSSQFNLLVLILALWSAFGALVTAASLFVALHSDARPEKLHEFAVDFSKDFVEQFMNVSFWTAFVGLALATGISLGVIVKRVASLVRQSRRIRTGK